MSYVRGWELGQTIIKGERKIPLEIIKTSFGFS